MCRKNYLSFNVSVKSASCKDAVKAKGGGNKFDLAVTSAINEAFNKDKSTRLQNFHRKNNTELVSINKKNLILVLTLTHYCTVTEKY